MKKHTIVFLSYNNLGFKISSDKIWIYQPYALSLRYNNRAKESQR